LRLYDACPEPPHRREGFRKCLAEEFDHNGEGHSLPSPPGRGWQTGRVRAESVRKLDERNIADEKKARYDAFSLVGQEGGEADVEYAVAALKEVVAWKSEAHV
jgi:hypothetical protein